MNRSNWATLCIYSTWSQFRRLQMALHRHVQLEACIALMFVFKRA